jgi:chromosome segregation ATPase
MSNFVNDLVDRRLGFGQNRWDEDDEESIVEVPELVDMSKYENALQTIEDKQLEKQREEQNRLAKIEQYQADLEQLKVYEEQLQEHKEENKDILRELQEDKKKINDEIKALQKK